MVYGTVDIVDCIEVTMDGLKANKHNHQIDDLSIVKYKKIYAWVLSNPKLYNKPVPYVHKKGTIIWINI